MIKGIIYKYTSPEGKCYIGQTTRQNIRKIEFNCVKHHYGGKKIKEIRKVYPTESFKYEVLYSRDFLTEEDASISLDILETYYIDLYDSLNNGYNNNLGGHSNHGYKWSEEQREYFSKLFSGEKNPNFGKHLSKEAKKRISDANKGRKLTKEQINKIQESCKNSQKCKDVKNRFIELVKQPRSDEWKKKIGESNKNSEKRKEAARKKQRKIIQYDLDYNFIKEWESIKEASNSLNMGNGTISNVLAGRIKSCKGFIFKYKL